MMLLVGLLMGLLCTVATGGWFSTPPPPPSGPARQVRWGIMGTATVARKVAWAIEGAENAVLAAVASRTTEKAVHFTAAYTRSMGHARFYGSYEELLADPMIEVIYVPLPTAVAKEWVIKVCAANKHVLADKPFASAADVAQMRTACAGHGVQFMDATAFMHNTRMDSIQSMVRLGVLDEMAVRYTGTSSSNVYLQGRHALPAEGKPGIFSAGCRPPRQCSGHSECAARGNQTHTNPWFTSAPRDLVANANGARRAFSRTRRWSRWACWATWAGSRSAQHCWRWVNFLTKCAA